MKQSVRSDRTWVRTMNDLQGLADSSLHTTVFDSLGTIYVENNTFHSF